MAGVVLLQLRYLHESLGSWSVICVVIVMCLLAQKKPHKATYCTCGNMDKPVLLHCKLAAYSIRNVTYGSIPHPGRFQAAALGGTPRASGLQASYIGKHSLHESPCAVDKFPRR